MKTKTFAVGTKVKLTDKFLRSTGQHTGSAGLDRWTVQACTCNMCVKGDWVRTDEKITPDYFTPEELIESPHLAFLHIAIANLQAC